MEKFERIWKPVLQSFKLAWPQYYEDMVDWYPSGYLEITIKLKDGRRLLYEMMGDYIRFNKDSDYDLDELDEARWKNNFAKCLTTRMRKCGISQDDLVRMTGISRITLSKYMNGRAIPNGYNLERLARSLKCSISELTNIP